MALTLANLRTLMDNFGTYLDNYQGASPTAAQKTDQINWAIRNLARKLFLYDPRITLDLTKYIASTNQTTFNIRDVSGGTVSKAVIEPYVVYIAGNPLLDYKGRAGLWSMSQLDRNRPTWRTDATGTPSIAVYVGGPRLILSPGPTAAGSNNFIAGTYMPAALVNSTDDAANPDIGIVEELHECISYYAAVHVAMPTATEQEQWTRVAAYNAEWNEIVGEEAMRNRNAIEGPWSDAGYAYGGFIEV